MYVFALLKEVFLQYKEKILITLAKTTKHLSMVSLWVTLDAEFLVEGWGSSFRSPWLTFLLWKLHPISQGKGDWGPRIFRSVVPKIQLPYHEWGGGWKKQVYHTHLELSLTNRYQGIGWEMLMFSLPKKIALLLGSGCRWNPVFLVETLWSFSVEFPSLAGKGRAWVLVQWSKTLSSYSVYVDVFEQTYIYLLYNFKAIPKNFKTIVVFLIFTSFTEVLICGAPHVVMSEWPSHVYVYVFSHTVILLKQITTPLCIFRVIPDNLAGPHDKGLTFSYLLI